MTRPRKRHDRSQWAFAPHDRYQINRLVVPSTFPLGYGHNSWTRTSIPGFQNASANAGALPATLVSASSVVYLLHSFMQLPRIKPVQALPLAHGF